MWVRDKGGVFKADASLFQNSFIDPEDRYPLATANGEFLLPEFVEDDHTLRPSRYLFNRKELRWVSRHTPVLHAFRESPSVYAEWAPMTDRLRQRLKNPAWDEKPACASLFCAEIDTRTAVGIGEEVEISVGGCARIPKFAEEVWVVKISGPETTVVDLTWDVWRRAHAGKVSVSWIG